MIKPKNRSLLFLLIAMITLCRTEHVFGQDFPMLHFTSDNGLPGNTVYQVYRDSKGFLWFGTDKGVARYNGIKFDVYTTFNGLPDNEVFLFSEDLYGRLWLVSFNGELCYYKNDTFHTARNTPLLKLPFQLPRVKFITPQKDSSVIITLNNYTKFLNITANKCHLVDIKKVYQPSKYGGLIYRKKESHNRYKLTFANKAILVDTLMDIKQQFDVDTFRMDTGGNAQMFTSCQNQDYLFNKQNIYTAGMSYVAKFPADFHKKNYLNRIFLCNEYRFFATTNGLYINDTMHLLKEQNVSSVSNDRYGNYWISTLNDGVFVLMNDFKKTGLSKGLYNGQVKYSFAHKGQLFYGLSNGNFYGFNNSAQKCLINVAEIKKQNYLTNSTHNFYLDSNYRYFSIVGQDLMCNRNIHADKTTYKYIDAATGTKAIFYLNNNLYLRKSDAIIKMRLDSMQQTTAYQLKIGINHSDDRITWMTKDNADNLWYATAKGLYTITDTGSVTEQKGFSNSSMKVFEFIGDDMVGYNNDNLLLVFRNWKTKMTVDTISLDDCIWDRLYKIDEGHILISNNNLYRLLTVSTDRGNRQYKLSVIDNPFIPLQANAVATDGSVCYFMKDGMITRFDKECLIAKQPPPKLYFTELRSGTRSYQIGDRLVIPFGESGNMTISFATVSFPGNKVTYQYSISKSDDEHWADIKGEDINLVHSGYGKYTIKIRAKTTSSEFSRPVEFGLRITRPFWTRWWFVLLTITGIIYAIVFVSRKRLKYILNKKDKEHEMKVRFMKSEYKALNALMNPHFVFNTLNNVQGLINKNDKLAANEYIRVIADLVRQNMHNISKELIPLQKEIDLVSNYLLLEKLRFKEKLNYNIIIDKGLDLSEIMIPPLLIQPLVENSIKHGILPLEGREGHIYLNIFERKGSLCIEVKDNGVGLNYKKNEKLSKHESFGLENIKKRIEQLSIIQNKTITFDIKERTNDTGSFHWTVVSIVIPLDE
ncbi:MAG: histidine kinase [Taibaiella sp.]|nr:histidine kinase [Taibaiella sp.]